VDEAEENAKRLILQALECTRNLAARDHLNRALEQLQWATHSSAGPFRPIVDKEGYLWKKGKALHLWRQRFYLLSGNCVYYYAHETDVRPRGVIFLTGSVVEPLQHDEEHELRGWYGFEIVNGSHPEQKRILYTRSREERDEWVNALQHAAEVVPIEEDYVIGKELGHGRFSHVCDCVHKATGKHYAVKIIDKNAIEPEEKELLRTEIAVLKLVHHPHIIRLQAVYESRSNIFIVMELLHGGELFDRIVGRPRFTEAEAAKVIRPLIESVAYLHDLGIVHRDIKPENILCGDDLSDLKIADFGLSKLLLPKETMRMPCGTLSYVGTFSAWFFRRIFGCVLWRISLTRTSCLP
jgi:tRNA A-37 threonylcarbamoyl transferase component Bud32